MQSDPSSSMSSERCCISLTRNMEHSKVWLKHSLRSCVVYLKEKQPCGARGVKPVAVGLGTSRPGLFSIGLMLSVFFDQMLYHLVSQGQGFTSGFQGLACCIIHVWKGAKEGLNATVVFELYIEYIYIYYNILYSYEETFSPQNHNIF